MTVNRVESRRRSPDGCLPFILVALIGLAGCAGDNANSVLDARTRLKLAEASQAGGDVVGSLGILRVLAEQSPDNVEAQLRYAHALADAGQLRQALAAARRAQSRRPGDPEANLLVARLQLRLGEPDVALAGYQRVVAADPRNVAAWRGQGVAQATAGDLAAAEASFRAALALAPGDLGARNDLALTLALTNRPTEAVVMLRGLMLESDNSRVRHNLALAYAVSGERDKAIALLTPELGGDAAAQAATVYARLADTPRLQTIAQLGRDPTRK